MTYKITLIRFTLALMLAVSAAPVYAGDEDDLPPPPCSVCDGNLQGWG